MTAPGPDQPANTSEEGARAPRRVTDVDLRQGLPPKVRLAGVGFDSLTEAQCIRHVVAESAAGRGGWIVTANLDHLRRFVHDKTYAELCADATIVVADGMPLIWASRIQGTPLPERVAGSSMTWTLSAAAAEGNRSVYLLGGSPGTADGAAEALTQRCPGLRIAGTHCPPMGFEKEQGQTDKIVDLLVRARPDIVYVGLGSPKQEQLIRRLRQELPDSWWIGVGISFSFLCGEIQRAPRWVQRAGLEWAHRLVQEPGRLARRYLVHGCPFAVRLLVGSALVRVGAAFGRRRDGRGDVKLG